MTTRKTISTKSVDAELFDSKLLTIMLALEQIGEGLQKTDPCQFTGHTMFACIDALHEQAHGRIEEIHGAGVNANAKEFLSLAKIALADYRCLVQATFGYEAEIEHPCAVGAALEALAQKAAKQINLAAWSCGVKPIDFSIGDYGHDEHVKKAA